MIKFLAEAHRGVQGFVLDPTGTPIERASLKIKGRDVGFQTTKHGEFWRILLPGYYKLEVSPLLLQCVFNISHIQIHIRYIYYLFITMGTTGRSSSSSLVSTISNI